MPEHLFVRFGEKDPQFAETSVMLRHIRAFDWSRSPTGAIEDWPCELKFAVRTILLSASAMAVLIGREGIVIQNDAARIMFGDHYDGALGRPIGKVLPIAARFYGQAIAACYEGKGVRFVDQPIKLFRNGAWETAWFSLGFTPIADEQAHVFGVLLVASETTERMRALAALRRSRQRLDLALDAGGIVGTWDLDVRTNRVTTNGTFAQMFGVTEENTRLGVSNDILSTAVHPDDREKVLYCLKHAIATGSDYRCRYRAVTPQGDIRWFIVSGRPVRDERERVVQLAGIVIDVTEQTETAKALEQSNLRFDILTESIPQIVWSTDAKGRHDYFNRRWSEFTGIPPERIKPETWRELVHSDDWPRVEEVWRECLATGQTYDIDYRFLHHEGGYRWLKVLAMPLRDAEGKITRWYGTATDIDDAKQIEAQRQIVSHELDHRIKNLFALVNGLVSLSVRDDPALRPVAEVLRSRLTALHQAHGLIHGQQDAKGGSLRGLLQQLLQPYDSGRPEQIVMEGPDVIIDPGAITSVALVFHELITNAAKYGALTRGDGCLLIELRSHAGRQLIEWRERFCNDVIVASSGGFGARLLETIIEGQLRGSLKRELSAEGILIVIDVPLSVLCATPNAAQNDE